SDLRQRQEGVRIKHRLNDNSVKLYDKSFTELVCLLRAEATFNSVNDFRVYRPKEGDPAGELAWRPLRRGIADLHRRAEVSRKATEHYLDALASVDEHTTLAHGLIYKVTGTHRYHLTKAGRIATTAILTALRSSVRQLTAAAA